MSSFTIEELVAMQALNDGTLSLMIRDTGACTYLEYGYLVDILKVASRIRWMH